MPLTDIQKGLATQQLHMGPLLSLELQQAMMRANVATSENAGSETGLVEFVAGLKLHFGELVTRHFSGDFDALVQQVFPKHRYGEAGMVPEPALEAAAQEAAGESCDFGTFFRVKFTEELSRVLWNAVRLSSALGKPASFLDFIAALSLDNAALRILAAKGISLKGEMRDFQQQFGAVVFAASFFANPRWGKEQTFDLPAGYNEPFTIEVQNPVGRFEAVKEGEVRLNGHTVVWVSRDKPQQKLSVHLQEHNVVSVDLKGRPFEGICVILRGTPGMT